MDESSFLEFSFFFYIRNMYSYAFVFLCICFFFVYNFYNRRNNHFIRRTNERRVRPARRSKHDYVISIFRM